MVHCYQKPLWGSSIGVVFGSFAPMHQGHLDLIMRAKKENDGGCLVIVCGYSGDKGEPIMPRTLRYRYVRELFASDDLVAVYSIDDTELGLAQYPNGWEGWMAEFECIWEKAVNTSGVQRPSRHWYVGDESYYNDLKEMWGEDVTLVDRNADNPISATMIRNDPIKHWNKIAFPFRRVFSTNILVAGTASEGKTTLVQDIGKYFNIPYSHEWARDYIDDSCLSELELEAHDFMAFLQGQYALNKRLINSRENNGVFIADTDSMVTKMYAKHYADDPDFKFSQEDYEKVANVADEITAQCRWDKIFLIVPHGVFVDDHSRYMGHSGMEDRRALYAILEEEMKRSGNWDKVQVLTGSYWENFCAVRDYIKGLR